MEKISYSSYPLHALLFSSIIFFIYLNDSNYIDSGDARPAQSMPSAILDHGSLTFNHRLSVHRDKHTWFKQHNGNLVSAYSPLPGMIHTVVVFFDSFIGLNSPSKHTANFTAALLTAGCIFFMYLTFHTLNSNRFHVFVSSMLLSFASSLWSVASQTLWEHTPAIFFLSVAIYFCVRNSSPMIVGLCLGLSCLSRYPLFILLLPFGLYAFINFKKALSRAQLCLGASLPVIFLIWYHYKFFGSVYGFLETGPRSLHSFESNPIDGMLGLLFSPARGLFLFAPFFLLICWKGKVLFTNRFKWLNTSLLIGSIAYLILISKWSMWWGGVTYSYRMIIELTLILSVFLHQLMPLVLRFSSSTLFLVIASIVSIYFQFLGVFYYPCVGYGPNNLTSFRERHAWTFARSQIAMCTRKLLREAPKERVIKTVRKNTKMQQISATENQ